MDVIDVLEKCRENNIKFNTVSNNEFLSKGNHLNKIDILFKKIQKNND